MKPTVIRTALGLALACIIFSIPISPATSPSLMIGVSSQLNTSISPDFSISASPNILTLSQGTTGSSSITLESQGGFSGNIALSASSFFDVWLEKTNVTLSSGGTVSTTVALFATSDTPPGSYTSSVQAISGCTSSHSAYITLNVTGPDFTMSPGETVLTAPPGSSTSTTVRLASTNGFSGTVALSSFSFYLNPTLSPTTVSLTPSGTGISTLTVTVPSATQPGNYTLEVAGSDSSLFHSVEINVTVTGPGFTLSATPYYITVLAGGTSNSSTITITPFGGFAGTVSLTAPSSSSGLVTSLSPTTITIPGTQTSVLTVTASSGTTPGPDFSITVTGTTPSFTGSVRIFVIVKGPDFDISSNPSSVTVAAGSSSCTATITVTGFEGFSGTVGLTETTFPTGLSASLSVNSVTGSGTATLTISAPGSTAPGHYYIEVDGTSGPLYHFASVTVLVTGSDFSLANSPAALTTNPGSTVTSTITAVSQNSFNGPVALSASTSSTYISASINPSSVTGSGTATLTVTVSSMALPGVSIVEVSGVSGPLTHYVFLSLTVNAPDFSLSANPDTLTIGMASPGASTITITRINGFTGPVSLSVPPVSNLNTSIQPTVIVSDTATLRVNSTTVGSYAVEVDGHSGPLFHSITVLVTVRGPDFSLPSGPVSLTIQAGSSSSTAITVTPAYGFTGAVSLTATVSPAGPTVSFDTATITGGSGMSTLTVSTDSNVGAGNYTVTVTASSGSISHSVQVPVTVTSSPGSSDILGLSPTVFYILIGGVIAATSLTGLLVLRTRKKTV